MDQVLVSVLPLKHNFVRGFGVGKSVLIVDEVHAYDHYMYGLLDEVLKNQQACGGSAILLSATLPSEQRSLLLSAWGVNAEIRSDSPYPLISHCQANGAITTFVLPENEKPKPAEVAIEVLPRAGLLPDEALLEDMLQAAESGAQVVFICNLVDVAQTLAKRLRTANRVPVEVFHARYRFGDRQTKEKRVMDYFGKKGSRDQGRILIATQVVEQSLDLDFDWMLTQLCPVDLLFQRLGRLHRHSRPRPLGFEKARCTVLIPDKEDYGLDALIYGNTRVLWRTARVLLDTGDKVGFPDAYRTWIELVYCEEPWPGEPDEVIESFKEFLSKAEASRYSALQIVKTGVGAFSDADAHVSFLTRDGEMNLNVLPVEQAVEGLRLLDDTLLKSLGDDTRDEVLNLNTVPVRPNMHLKDWR